MSIHANYGNLQLVRSIVETTIMQRSARTIYEPNAASKIMAKYEEGQLHLLDNEAKIDFISDALDACEVMPTAIFRAQLACA